MSDHPWIKSYPPGVRWDAPLPTSAVTRLLDDAVDRWREHPAIEFLGRRFTYGELQALVDRAAHGLQQLGVGPGVHVGLFLPNTPHYMIAFLGILRAGGTVVNYSPLDAEKVLEHKIGDSETDILITLDLATLYPPMARMLDRTRLRRLVVGSLAEMTGQPDAVSAQLRAEGQLCAVADDERQTSFARLLDNAGTPAPVPSFDPAERIAVLQYTGGTTGLPKGAMLTHANLTTACSQLRETANAAPESFQEGAERVLVVLPLFHIYALTVTMLYAIRMGAEMVIHPRFDPEAALRDISSKKISVFPGVPTMFTALVNHPEVGRYDLRSLKFCNSGGAPLPGEVLQRFLSLGGCDLLEGWGMTETSPTGTFTPMKGGRRAGSCGLPAPGITFRFASLTTPGTWAPLGERGEICVAGPNIMKGYWKKPDATAESIPADGFFRTGDVGYMDEDGYVYIVDRTKDMLLCGGYNVYPRVIEEAIYEHPAVEEVSVIGIPDEYRGQSPKAYVKLKAGAAPFSLAELQAFLKGRLGKHEMVQALELRDALPKTPVGKLSKKELYAELDSGS